MPQLGALRGLMTRFAWIPGQRVAFDRKRESLAPAYECGSGFVGFSGAMRKSTEELIVYTSEVEHRGDRGLRSIALDQDSMLAIFDRQPTLGRAKTRCG